MAPGIVVAVCGDSRSGKSTILSQLLADAVLAETAGLQAAQAGVRSSRLAWVRLHVRAL